MQSQAHYLCPLWPVGPLLSGVLVPPLECEDCVKRVNGWQILDPVTVLGSAMSSQTPQVRLRSQFQAAPSAV